MTQPGWIEDLPRDRLICEFSAWSADLTRLADEMARIAPHVDILHVDAADGHFAPAFLYFPDLVAQLRKVTAAPIHVHLMVADYSILLEQVSQFAEAGSDLISIHAENANAAEALALIEEKGAAAGMVLKVDTPVETIAPHLGKLRFVTLLGTAIGVKGQGLSETATTRLQRATQLIAASNSPRRIVLAADGGIRELTVPLLRGAGAETVVLGSLAFNAPDLAARMAWLHGL